MECKRVALRENNNSVPDNVLPTELSRPSGCSTDCRCSVPMDVQSRRFSLMLSSLRMSVHVDVLPVFANAIFSVVVVLPI